MQTLILFILAAEAVSAYGCGGKGTDGKTDADVDVTWDLDSDDVPDVPPDVEEDIPDVDASDPVEEDPVAEDQGEDEQACAFLPLACATGDLRSLLEAIDIGSATFSAPGSVRRTQWETLIGHVLAHNWANTYVRAETMGVDVTAVSDTVSGRDYIMVHDPSNGEGVYVLNVTPSRDLVIEVPYPADDAGTLAQGIETLRGTGGQSGWALLVGGTARCASTSIIPCDGTTVACTGSAEGFRMSDAAHNPNLVFQLVHVQLMDHSPTPAGGTSLAIQLQDQSDATGAYAYVSDGTTTDGTGLSTGLRDALRSWFPAWTSLVLSCNDAADRALGSFHSDCQTTNIQGRWTNNPTGTPCSMPAPSSSNRFVVLEQGPDMRDPTNLGSFVQAIYDLP